MGVMLFTLARHSSEVRPVTTEPSISYSILPIFLFHNSNLIADWIPGASMTTLWRNWCLWIDMKDSLWFWRMFDGEGTAPDRWRWRAGAGCVWRDLKGAFPLVRTGPGPGWLNTTPVVNEQMNNGFVLSCDLYFNIILAAKIRKCSHLGVIVT